MMALTNVASISSARTQTITFYKHTHPSTAYNTWYHTLLSDGEPAVANDIPGNTANGIIISSPNTAYPTIAPFGGSNTGYISALRIASNMSYDVRYQIVDHLFSIGPFSAANTSLQSITTPSWSSRIPGGNYNQTQVWVTAGNGSGATAPTIKLDYLDQNGSAANSTYTLPQALNRRAPIWRFPLAAGSTGISALTGLTQTNASSTGNICVWVTRSLISNIPAGDLITRNIHGDRLAFHMTGLPIVQANSALALICFPPNALGVPVIEVDIVEG